MFLFPSNVPLIVVIPYYLSQRVQGWEGCLCLKIHTILFHFLLAESPWGLPLVADGPASMAKVVMAELTNLKLETSHGLEVRPCLPPEERIGRWRPGAPSLQEAMSTV